MNILRDVVNRDELLHGKRVLFVGEDARESDLIASIFDENSHLDVFSETGTAMQHAREQSYDMAFVSLSLSEGDPLRLCSQLRSHVETRYIPILVIVDNSEPKLVSKALELGVNDYIMRPVDFSKARALAQSSHRRYHEELRGALEKSVDMAFTDGDTPSRRPLTASEHRGPQFRPHHGRHRPFQEC